VRQALGDDAVVLSTKPCAKGVEVLAMARKASSTSNASPLRRRPRSHRVPTLAPLHRPSLPAAKPPRKPKCKKGRVEQTGDEHAVVPWTTCVNAMLKRREAAMKAEAPAVERVEPEMSPLQAKLNRAP